MTTKHELGRWQICGAPRGVAEHEKGWRQAWRIKLSGPGVEHSRNDFLHVFYGILCDAIRLWVVGTRLDMFDIPLLAEDVKLVAELRTPVRVDDHRRTVSWYEQQYVFHDLSCGSSLAQFKDMGKHGKLIDYD